MLARLRGIKKKFAIGDDSVVALDGVSIDVEAGKILALTGPNGSGKTTLLRILAGDLEPDEGVVELEGKGDVTREGRRARASWVAWVDQDPRRGTFPHLTVAENLVLAGLRGGVRIPWRGLPSNDVLAKQVESFLPTLAARMHQPAGLLSGGERQILSIAMAVAAPSVKVLCLDEPWASLDANATNAVADVVARLAREKGLAIVLASHATDPLRRHPCVLVAISNGVRLVAERGGVQARVVSAPAAVEGGPSEASQY